MIKEDADLYKKVVSSNKTVGADELMQLIKNYCRQGDVKTSITVGVVGFPNVGKSSLINSLKKIKVASVSNVPGHTKAVQEIYLDKNVRLLDCPGVILTSETSDSIMLRNVIKIEDLPDPITPVDAIAKRITKDVMKELYKIDDYETTQEMLANIARKRGRLMKKGIPDIDDEVRWLRKDGNNGKIPFQTPCPTPRGPTSYF